MAINPAWTQSDTTALKAEALGAAQDVVSLRRRLAAILKTLTDNEIDVLADLVDVEGEPITKQQLKDLMDYRGNFELLNENGVPEQGYWGAKIGKMVKVFVG